MATATDWTTRVGRVTGEFTTTLPELITNYEMKTRAVGDLLTQIQKLENEKGRLTREAKLSEIEASTADREFIEVRKTMPDPFKPSKIYTVQDFTFYLFFVSYFIFLVAISMMVQEKIKTFVGGIAMLFFIVALFYRYI
jgi:hypothetical protein